MLIVDYWLHNLNAVKPCNYRPFEHKVLTLEMWDNKILNLKNNKNQVLLCYKTKFYWIWYFLAQIEFTLLLWKSQRLFLSRACFWKFTNFIWVQKLLLCFQKIYYCFYNNIECHKKVLKNEISKNLKFFHLSIFYGN